MIFQPAHGLACVEIDDTNHMFIVAQRNRLAIGINSKSLCESCLIENVYKGFCLKVPDTKLGILADRDQPGAVGRKFRGVDFSFAF